MAGTGWAPAPGRLVRGQEGQIVHVQADGLGDPGPGPVQQFQQRPVAQRARAGGVVPGRGRGDQPLDLRHADGPGQPARRGRGAHRAGRVGAGQPPGGRERVQAADRDHGATRRTGGQREMLLVALPQPGQERGHILGGHLADDGPAPGGQRHGVAVQVAPVGLQGPRGQAALDREVIEVRLDRARKGGQLSTSLTPTAGSPCASATGRQVSPPSWVCSPSASAGSARSAPAQPRLASSTT